MKHYFFQLLTFLLTIFFVFSTQIKAFTDSQTVPLESNNQAILSVECINISDLNEIPDDHNNKKSHFSIRAADYCAFLNQKAPLDKDFFYDDKMGSDQKTACIRRERTLDNVFYMLIEGRENSPITYLSQKNVIAFINWLENKTLPEDQDEATLEEEDSYYFFRNNFLGYQITKESYQMNCPIDTDIPEWNRVFDYTPGATASQRFLEGLGFYFGFAGGLYLGPQTVFLFPDEIGLRTKIGLAFISMFITAFIVALLGEKFGKWLGS